MFEYKFIRIELSFGITSKPREDYKEIIRNEGKEGWELVQIFAPSTSGYGRAAYFELIFKKKVSI